MKVVKLTLILIYLVFVVGCIDATPESKQGYGSNGISGMGDGNRSDRPGESIKRFENMTDFENMTQDERQAMREEWQNQ